MLDILTRAGCFVAIILIGYTKKKFLYGTGKKKLT